MTDIIKIDRLPQTERVLQRARNLPRLVRILRRTGQGEVLQDGRGELYDIVDEGLVVEGERVWCRRRPDAVLVADLDSVERRVAVDDRVALGAADAGGGLEAVGDGPAQCHLQDLAVGELDEAPGVVGVTELGEVAIDRLLAKGDDAVDLLLGVGDVVFHVEKISAHIDLSQLLAQRVEDFPRSCLQDEYRHRRKFLPTALKM